MKQNIKKLLSCLNKAWLRLQQKDQDIGTSRFFRTKIINLYDNPISIRSSTLENTRLRISGLGNTIDFNGAYLAGATISVEGFQNKIIFEKGVMFRNSSLVIRGENCSVRIGTDTKFGGIRIVNVGKNNPVSIGSGCLFSDHIELWASDTHSILDENGAFINPEKAIHIGNKVWVGCNVTILKGVSIMDGSIIGMGSVITKDVPANVISAGYPNKTIKERVTWALEYPPENYRGI